MDTEHGLTGLKKATYELKREITVTKWLLFVLIVLLLFRHL